MERVKGLRRRGVQGLRLDVRHAPERAWVQQGLGSGVQGKGLGLGSRSFSGERAGNDWDWAQGKCSRVSDCLGSRTPTQQAASARGHTLKRGHVIMTGVPPSPPSLPLIPNAPSLPPCACMPHAPSLHPTPSTPAFLAPVPSRRTAAPRDDDNERRTCSLWSLRGRCAARASAPSAAPPPTPAPAHHATHKMIRNRGSPLRRLRVDPR
eukprot:3050320-Rhodomonas_salina.2